VADLGTEAEDFVAIYISTVRKHDLNIIDAIYDALTGNSFTPYPVEAAAGIVKLLSLPNLTGFRKPVRFSPHCLLKMH
jgi:hypothetical protein